MTLKIQPFPQAISFLLVLSKNFEAYHWQRHPSWNKSSQEMWQFIKDISNSVNFLSIRIFSISFRKNNIKWKKWTIYKKKQGLSTIGDAFLDFSSQIRQRHCRFCKEKVKNDKESYAQAVKYHPNTLKDEFSPSGNVKFQGFTPKPLGFHPYWTVYYRTTPFTCTHTMPYTLRTFTRTSTLRE